MPSEFPKNVGGLTIDRGLLLQSKKPITVDDAGVEESTFAYRLRNENYPALVPAKGVSPVEVSPDSPNLGAFAHLGKQTHRFTHNGACPGVGILEVLYRGAIFTDHSSNVHRRSAYIPITLTPASGGSVNVTASPTGVLRVGDLLICSPTLHWTAPGSNYKFYVVAVSGANVQLSTTAGGSALTFDNPTTGVTAAVMLGAAGSDVFYAGDTSDLSVDQAISFSFVARSGSTSDTYPHAGSRGPFYVKEIVDDYHIKVSSTIGGAAVTIATEDWVFPVLDDQAIVPAGTLYVSYDEAEVYNVTTPYITDGLTPSTVTLADGSAEVDYYAIDYAVRYVAAIKPLFPLYLVDPYIVDDEHPAPTIVVVRGATDLFDKEIYMALVDFNRKPCGRFWEVTETLSVRLRKKM